MVTFCSYGLASLYSSLPPPGIKASSKTVPPVSWTRPNSVVYINNSSPLEIPETLQTTSSTSLTRTKMVLLTLRSSSVLSASRVVEDWTRSSNVRTLPTSFSQPHLISLAIFSGAFQLYDIDKDGFITYDEMLQIVSSIYKMTGQMVKLPADEDTPEKVISSSPPHLCPLTIPNVQRVDKIFRNMDRNKDARLTYDEFVEGSKQDPTIVQVSPRGVHMFILGPRLFWCFFSFVGFVTIRWSCMTP
jgi:hypothetical protein